MDRPSTQMVYVHTWFWAPKNFHCCQILSSLMNRVLATGSLMTAAIARAHLATHGWRGALGCLPYGYSVSSFCHSFAHILHNKSFKSNSRLVVTYKVLFTLRVACHSFSPVLFYIIVELSYFSCQKLTGCFPTSSALWMRLCCVSYSRPSGETTVLCTSCWCLCVLCSDKD